MRRWVASAVVFGLAIVMASAMSEEEYNKNKWESLLSCVVCRKVLNTTATPGVKPGKVELDSSALLKQCEKHSSVFKVQCIKGMQMVIASLKGKTQVNKSQLSNICHRSGVCPVKFLSPKESAARLKKPCKAGQCTIHHHVSNVVLSGDLESPQSKTTIPQKIHFIFGMQPDFGGKPFNLLHYLAVRSAHDLMPEATVFMYYKFLPAKNKWWDLAKQYVRLIQVDPVTSVDGNPVVHVAHVADVLRLQILRDIGGIYLDIDMITLKPYTRLMKEQFVMGHEGEKGVYGLCNAAMMSAPNSQFALTWVELFGQAYDPYVWSMHSVKLPSMLEHLYPEMLSVQPHDTFFYPLWDKLEHMFRGHGDSFPNNIAMHTWESLAYDNYIMKLTEKSIREEDNNFNLAVRRFLP